MRDGRLRKKETVTIHLRATNTSGETPESCQQDPTGKMCDSEVIKVIKDSRERNNTVTVYSTNNLELNL